MSKTPFANKNSNTKELYKSREIYEEFYPTDIDQFDLWNNLPLYGRVDNEGTTVFPRESKLVYITQSSDRKQLAVLNFVADAFNDLTSC